MIAQWGKTATLTADSSKITFPIAFSTTNYSVAPIQTSSGDSKSNISITTQTTSTFTLYAQSNERSKIFHWLAIGY